MKTLGFGLKSLKRDPEWARKHNIDPYNQTAGSVVGDPKSVKPEEDAVSMRAKKGEIDASNSIFSQENLSRINKFKPEEDFQSKLSKLDNNKNIDIFSMMNKFDKSQSLQGANTLENDPLGINMANNEELLQKKLGKKLNILM